MRFRATLALVLGSVVLFGTTSRAEWRMPRGDIRRTGVAAGVLGVSTPAIRWKRYIGGEAPWMSFVAAGVGGDDIVYIAASDRLEARRTDDTLLWQTGLNGVRSVLGRVDLDGDGDLEVVAVSGFGG